MSHILQLDCESGYKHVEMTIESSNILLFRCEQALSPNTSSIVPLCRKCVVLGLPRELSEEVS
jgi:hypothetical protein